MLISSDSANTSISASWSYPYNLKTAPIKIVANDSSLNTISIANDVKPAAEFFVFTGVTSMLLSLGFVILYVLMDRNYRSDERFPLIDFIVTAIWSIFWIAGSSAWAKGVSNIRSQTNWENVARRSQVCPNIVDCHKSNCTLWT